MPRQPDGSGNFNTKQGLSIPDDRYASSAYQVGNLIYTVHTVGLPANAPAPGYCALQWSVLQAVNDNTTVLVQQGMISNSNYDYAQFSALIASNTKCIAADKCVPSWVTGLLTNVATR